MWYDDMGQWEWAYIIYIFIYIIYETKGKKKSRLMTLYPVSSIVLLFYNLVATRDCKVIKYYIIFRIKRCRWNLIWHYCNREDSEWNRNRWREGKIAICRHLRRYISKKQCVIVSHRHLFDIVYDYKTDLKHFLAHKAHLYKR